MNFRNHNEFGTDILISELKLIEFCDSNKYLNCQFMYFNRVLYQMCLMIILPPVNLFMIIIFQQTFAHT